MFTTITPKVDSQLSNENVANLTIDDAISKIALLTGLSQDKAFALLSAQVNHHNKGVEHDVYAKTGLPLLEQNESQFIYSLFN